MTHKAYYNEIETRLCDWMQSLMDHGQIMAGTVDNRSIHDISPEDLKQFTRVHLFAGLAGWDYALQLAGIPASTSIWTLSCPCQPFSTAGEQKGSSDDRHLWPIASRLIGKRQPQFIVGEQVENAVGHGWLDDVSADLEGEDYSCGAAVLGAHSVRAPHTRQRLYWFAHAKRHVQPWQEPRVGQAGRVGRIVESLPWDRDWKTALSGFRALGDGVSRNLAATDAARNAIVPQTAAVFIQVSFEALNDPLLGVW